MELRAEHDLLVSVVVVVRNGERTLPALFEALRRQTMPPRAFEVIVVDDASTDHTAKLIKDSGVARLVSAPEHVGLPVGRNIGIKATRAAVLAMTDADCVPDPEWVERGWARFANGDVDMLAGEINVPLGDRPSLASLLDSARFFDQERYTADGFAGGANMWARRDLFDRVGLFNQNLAAYGGDDEEFGQRATARGARLVYAPDVRISHPPRQRLRDLARKRYRLGYGHAAQRRHASGQLRVRPEVFKNIRYYVPHRRIHRLERLQRRGIPVGKWRTAQLLLAQYLCVQLPWIAGDIAGEFNQRRVAR